MSISSARLLAHRCCLLLSVILFTPLALARTTRSASDKEQTENNGLHLDPATGKCQFNLTDSSHSLEAESTAYQHRGFSQCEYIIQAPSSRFILLNFTDIRSQFDMLVEPSVRGQQLQQAAATTTTTTPITTSQLSKSLIRKPFSRDENVASLQSYIDNQQVPVAVSTKVKNSNLSHPKRLHNTSVTYSVNNSESQKRQSSTHKPSSVGSDHEQILKKETGTSHRSFLNNGSDSLPASRQGNYLELSTFSTPSVTDTQTEPIVSSHNCSFKLIIEEVNGTSESNPQVICWGKSWQTKIPIVFQYSVPIRITYVWDRHSRSGFSLDFSFLRPEEVDHCLFQCNNHLCLPTNQLCDGYIDCLDHSDEHNKACLLVKQQEKNGESHAIKVIIIIISVIVGIIVVLALSFMINHCRCYDGAHLGGGPLLQPPHSHSSEVCQSPSDSMQESVRYEPMLHQHPRRQTTAPILTAASSHCSEHQQLLHPHQPPEVEQQHHLQTHRYLHLPSRNPCINQHHYMSQEHQIRSLSSNADGARPPDNQRVNRPLQHKQLQHKFVHNQQQSIEQQRQCKQAHKHVSPSELYPPNIPVSADGEEGYAMSQNALHSKQQLERNWQVQNEVFRPPPNKTVYDRDSPPPPYSLNPPGTKSLDSLVPPVGAVCVLRQTRSSLMHQGSPTGVLRSHSLSCHH